MSALRFGSMVRSFSSSASSHQLIKAPIQLFTLEGRYASALYSAAVKSKAVDAVEKDLKEIGVLLKTDSRLSDVLMNPLNTMELKKDALDCVMSKKKANTLTVNLFNVLNENRRMNKVEGVLSAFSTIMSAVRGEVICEVTTAKPLDAAMKKDLEAALGAFVKKGESIHLTLKVDPTIIGGMVVSIGDKYVDMSMASKLNMYSSLIRAAV